MARQKYDVDDKSLGEILSLGIFEVPVYQRGYSWRKEQVGQLWDDILLAMEDKGEEYFIGAMVFVREPKRPHSIIDGQQRLATLTLFLAALRDTFDDLGKSKPANELHRNIITENLAGEAKPVLKLSGPEGDYLATRIQPRKDSRSAEVKKKRRPGRPRRINIKEAYGYVCDLVAQEMEGRSKKKQLARLIEIAEFLRSSLVAVTTNVASDIDAYVVFEALNDRGLDLSISDLLKNHLYKMAARSKKLEVMTGIWEEAGGYMEGVSFPRFLRHHWLSAHEKVTQRKLYKRVKEYLGQQGSNSWEGFGRELADSAAHYRDLIFPPADDPLARDLAELRDMAVQQHLPLLLAAKSRALKAKELRRLMSLCESLTMRYSVVGDRNPNRLEAKYSEWARMLRERGPGCLGDIADGAQSLCPDDEEFKDGFLALERLKAPTARYILRKINDHVVGREGEFKSPSEVHIEHILPRSWTTDWLKVFSKQEAADCVERLGNLTLLAEPLNKKASNRSFATKAREVYAKSEVRITKDLAEIRQWDAQAIEQRQGQFAEMACKIWSF